MRRFGVTATLMPTGHHPPQGYLVDAETAEAAVEIVKSRVRDFHSPSMSRWTHGERPRPAIYRAKHPGFVA